MWRNAKLSAECENCGTKFRYFKGSSSGRFCSKKCCYSNPSWRAEQSVSKKGKCFHTDESRKKMSIASKGRKKTEATRENMRLAQKIRWADHKSVLSEYVRIRTSSLYREWKFSVFKRDKCTCQKCGATLSKLDAHHVVPFVLLVEEFKMGLISERHIHQTDNGITLCRPCHKLLHPIGFSIQEMKLFRAIRKLWKNQATETVITLGDFYEQEMNKVINSVKEKLNPI